MSEYEAVLLDVESGVATITFNRPERKNAWSWQLDHDFHDALAKCEASDEIRAIVVTGAGDAFCVGADLQSEKPVFSEEWAEGHPPEPATERYAYWKLRTPVIAALNGAAVGAGLTLPLLMDIRYAAEDAKMGFRFTPLGIIAEANAHWMLPRIVGPSIALELLISGRIFTGREAAEMGLVSRALPRDEVLPAAQELARGIAENAAPLPASIAKTLVYRFLEESDRDAAYRLESELLVWLMRQPDCVEGVTAWMERRPPQWKGSKNSPFPDSLGRSE